MTEEIAVEVSGLSKTYVSGFRRKKVQAIQNLSFEIASGEIVGLIGPNGAGKTTTMKILTGLVRPDAGTARLFGAPLSDPSFRSRLGYLPENPYFYEHLNAREILIFYGRLFGLPGDLLRERATALIARVGLEHAEDRPIKKYSKGMRQRIGIAQALINDPDLVILDEPQSGLDPLGRKDVRDLIFELHDEGKTVLLSSHILPDVEAVADRILLLNEGVLRESGDVADLTTGRTVSIDAVVRNIDDADVAELDGLRSSTRRGDFLVLTFDGSKSANELAADLLELGAELESLTPRKHDLEQIFIEDATATRETP